jgi:hypothetical protein
MVADGRLTQYYLGARIVRFDLNEIDVAMTGGALGAPSPRPAPQLRRGGRVGRGRVTPDGQKQCSRCGKTKPASDFARTPEPVTVFAVAAGTCLI